MCFGKQTRQREKQNKQREKQREKRGKQKEKQNKEKNRKTHNHPSHHGHLQSIKIDLGDKTIREELLGKPIINIPSHCASLLAQISRAPQ